MNIAEEKAMLREAIRAKRISIAADARKSYESALETRLLNLPALKQAKCIAVYNPVGSEACFVSNIEKLFLLEQHPIIAFPFVSSATSMFFSSFEIDDDRSILANPLRQTEVFDKNRLLEPTDIDVMLVPGLAFDKHGRRLGQGGGYYDRYLIHLRDDCLTVGIAFDEQIVDEIPREHTDCPVGYIVTPSRIIIAEK